MVYFGRWQKPAAGLARDFTVSLSLILLVITLFLWARSDQCTESVQLFDDHLVAGSDHESCYSFFLASGGAELKLLKTDIPYAGYKPGLVWERQAQDYDRILVNPPSFGIKFESIHNPAVQLTGLVRPKDRYVIKLSFWLPAALFAAPFLWMFIAMLRRHRRYLRRMQSGLCQKCGYDLRATPNVCPACGQMASAHAKVIQVGWRRFLGTLAFTTAMLACFLWVSLNVFV